MKGKEPPGTERTATVTITEPVEAGGNTLHPGTYRIAMPASYDPSEVTGVDILSDGLIYIVREDALEMDRDDAMLVIRERDRKHTAGDDGSETALLGPALDSIRAAGTRQGVQGALDWWRLAYDAMDTAPDIGEVMEELLELGVDSDQALARAKRRAAVALLRRVRSDLDLSLSELGELLDVDRSTIHRWETGALLPQSPGMLRLALERLAAEAGT